MKDRADTIVTGYENGVPAEAVININPRTLRAHDAATVVKHEVFHVLCLECM